MSKLTNAQVKELMVLACEAKKNGESLSNVFERFAKQTKRAKGTIRNVYYSSLKHSCNDEKYRKDVLGENSLSVAKIISFQESEANFILEKILIGVTFGKSVRRVINEITENPKLALRYQNKYRNLLRFEKQRVLDVRQKIVDVYGKCYNPYKKEGQNDALLAKLKREINGLCDRLILEKSAENLKLKQKIEELEKENERLLGLKESLLQKRFTVSQDNVL